MRASVLAVSDGTLGFWKVLAKAFLDTREQWRGAAVDCCHHALLPASHTPLTGMIGCLTPADPQVLTITSSGSRRSNS